MRALTVRVEHARRLAARLNGAPPQRLRFWLRLILVAVLLGLISHGHFAGSGDPVHYMTIARSLVFDGDLDVANDYTDPDTLIQKGGLEMGAHARTGPGGVVRPVHDVGLPLISAPYFAAAYAAAKYLTPLLPEGLRRRAKLDEWIMLRQLMSLGMIVAAAWLAGMLFDTCLELTGRRAASWLGTMLWALSPPILSHAYVFFPEIPGALVALALFRAGSRVREGAPWRCLALGLGAGLMSFLHVRYAPLGLAFFLLLALRLRQDTRRLGALSLGFLAATAARTLLNLHLWGTWLTTPHASLGRWTGGGEQVRGMLERAAGLAFDQEHGLLLWAPVYLLAPAGLWLLRGFAARAAAEIVVLGAAYLLPILSPLLNAHGWRGGWSPAARFLVPIAPLLGLLVVVALSQRRGRGLLFGLVGVQVLIDAALWSRPMLQWSDGTGKAPFFLAVGGDGLAAALPSLTHSGGWEWMRLLGLAVLWMVATWALARGRAPAAETPGR